MRKRIFVTFLILPFLFPPSLYMSREDIVVYITEGNIYRSFFTEPFETLLIIFKDGDYFTFTTKHPQRIEVSAPFIKEFLQEKEKKIGDMAIIIHNHLLPKGFSFGNKFFYRYFKEKGFKGFFLIYFPFNDKAREKEIQ